MRDNDREVLHPRGFKPKWRNGRDILDMFGWRKAFGEVAPWYFKRRYIFYLHDLRAPQAVPPAAVTIRLERASGENLSDFLVLRPGYLTRGLLEKRLARGHLGFLVRSGDRPVLMRWVFLNRVFLPYLDRTLILSAGQAYTDDTYAAPEFRRLKIYSASGYSIRLALRDRGLTRAFSAIASWNTPPLKDAVRSGATRVGEGGYIHRFGSRSYSWTGALNDHGDGTISFL